MLSLIENYWPFRRLSARGVLGMNRRNIDYISRYNDRALYPLVDNKLRTKRLAMEHGVRTPELLAVIDNQHDANALGERLPDLDSFCLKPAKGSGGKGILVVTRSPEGELQRSNGQPLTTADIQRHVSNILAGLFSLGGAPDVAVMESLIQVDPIFRRFSFEGVPDLRVIVFRGFPVMAMMRLSCATSKGKANLHQGAVGVGIDIGSGRAVRAVQKDRPIEIHPDTNQNLLELQIPHWHELLELACTCYDMTGLGYLGVDLVVDKSRGPMLLELNARPGLSIQVANGCGLLPRLRRIESIPRPERMALADRIRFSRECFGTASTEPVRLESVG
ncbi:alpha-L-glutamate ligase-like protein [Gilvimarinus sp. F26214L]|uniref:alpha-L-glutamate ligase-like protein n=1 Tax=Gilvimarinus sp. DZF01 TaxID=3461371 RepID=UPI0040460AAD